MYQNKLRQICEEPLHYLNFSGLKVGGTCVEKSRKVAEVMELEGFRCKIVRALNGFHHMSVLEKDGRTFIYDASLFQDDLFEITDLNLGERICVPSSFSIDSQIYVLKTPEGHLSVDLELSSLRKSSLQNNTYNLEDASFEYPDLMSFVKFVDKLPVLFYRFYDPELEKQRCVIYFTSKSVFRVGFALESGFKEIDNDGINLFNHIHSGINVLGSDIDGSFTFNHLRDYMLSATQTFNSLKSTD